jgi:hypothetical protein
MLFCFGEKLAKPNLCNLHDQLFTLLYLSAQSVIKPLDRSNHLSRLIAIKETVSIYPAYTSMRLILEAYWIFEQSLQQIIYIKRMAKAFS